MKRHGGFVLPVALLLSLLVSTLLAGALTLAALRGKLAASAAGRLKDAAVAEGVVWLGISLAARDLLADPPAGVMSPSESSPTVAGDDPSEELPPGSRPVTSPHLPAGTGLWLAPRPPGRFLLTAHTGRGEGKTRRTGHLEYLETTPLSCGLLLESPGDNVLPAIAVAGRMAVHRRDGGITRFSRLDLALPPPPAGPGVGWTVSPMPGELAVVDGGVAAECGTAPTGRMVAIGELLPEHPFLFPEGAPLPLRSLVVRREGLFPPPPLPQQATGDTTLIGWCVASGLVLNGPPPWHGHSPTGRLSFEGDRLDIDGIVVIDGDVEFPAGTTYAGTGILAVTGDAVFKGDLLPHGAFPTEDSLAIIAGGEARLVSDEGGGGTLHAIISATGVAVLEEWTLFGTLVTGRIEGPEEASLSICPPPRQLIPFRGTPLVSSPAWLLLEAGCRDPDVRWP